MSGRDDRRRRRRRRKKEELNKPEFTEENALSARRRNQTAVYEKSRYDKNGTLYERPKWKAPELDANPLPKPECACCGKPINDIGSAIQDQQSGQPVHFDCVLTKLAEGETLERGDVLSYIGGGRFGIVHFTEVRPDSRNRLSRDTHGRIFTIKKIFEWENRENRADWRGSVADHYSLT